MAFDATTDGYTAEDVPRILDAAHALLDQLQAEYERVTWEVQAMGIADPFGTSLLDLDERAQSLVGFLEQIDRFVGDVFPRVERKALGPPRDVRRALALHDSTARILAVTRDTSPSGDLRADLVELTRGLVDDTDKMAKELAGLLKWVVAGLFAVAVATVASKVP